VEGARQLPVRAQDFMSFARQTGPKVSGYRMRKNPGVTSTSSSEATPTPAPLVVPTRKTRQPP
jgi:hypothetical protein